LKRQYHRPNLYDEIIGGLRGAGIEEANLTRHDLLPIDEFHIGGRAETEALAALIPALDNADVLDIGCGIGGPMRTLADDHNCRTTGLDYTFEYCRTARNLATLINIPSAIDIVCAAAPDLPFADSSFDVVWMQHTAMNVADKQLLAEEIDRVLRPGGRIAVHEVFSESGGEVHLPVFWADQPSDSFLEPPSQFRDRIARSGYDVLHWHDTTSRAAEWFARVIRRFDEKGVPPLSLQLVVGESFEQRARNVARNLAEGSISLYRGIFLKK